MYTCWLSSSKGASRCFLGILLRETEWEASWGELSFWSKERDFTMNLTRVKEWEKLNLLERKALLGEGQSAVEEDGSSGLGNRQYPYGNPAGGLGDGLVSKAPTMQTQGLKFGPQNLWK